VTNCSAADKKQDLSSTALSADQVAVYRAFLKDYDNGSGSDLNLSELTMPFDPDDTFTEIKAGEGCLKGLSFASLSAKDIHRFSGEFNEFKRIHLADPEQQRQKIKEADPGVNIRKGVEVKDAVAAGFAAGLLTLSEVVFDRSGKYALMAFSFQCGGLCGHGGIIVFEKQKSGEWKATKRECLSWIS
jgi:hypothetical protein